MSNRILILYVLIAIFTGCSTTPEPPPYARSYTIKGYDMLNKYENYVEALECFNQAIALDPDCDLDYNGRGTIYLIAGRYADALDDFTTAIKIDPTEGLYYNARASVYKELEEFEKSLFDLNAAIELRPRYSAAYYNRGIIFIELERFEEAVEDFTQAINLKPDHRDSYEKRGVIYYHLSEICLDEDMKMLYQEKGKKDLAHAKTMEPYPYGSKRK